MMKRSAIAIFFAFLALILAVSAKHKDKCKYIKGRRKYEGDKYLIKRIDATGKDGVSYCCQKCKETDGCAKYFHAGNGRTSGCTLFKKGAKLVKVPETPGQLSGYTAGKLK